jgi:hypothetical protein
MKALGAKRLHHESLRGERYKMLSRKQSCHSAMSPTWREGETLEESTGNK